MTRAHEDSRATPHLGGATAIVVFVFTLVAFVAESELTQVRIPDTSCDGRATHLRPLSVRSKQSWVSREFCVV